MITKLDFINAQTAATYSFDADFTPVQALDISTTDRVATDRSKAQAPGAWPTFPQLGGMEIHYEGQILADTPDDYVSKRKALITGLRGNPTAFVTSRSTGTLVLGLSGETEDWQTDVVLSAFSAPIEATGWLSAYLVTFFSFNPWFTGVTTPANIYVWS